MKDILIDLYKLKNLYSGLGQFSLNFAKKIISKKNTDLQLNFLVPKGWESRLNNSESTVKFTFANFQKRFFPILNQNYTLWHSLHQFPAFLPRRNTKWILTIHDLNFLTEKDEKKASSYLKKLQNHINRADAITTISEYSKKIIEENIDTKGKSVQVIYNGIPAPSALNAKKPKFITDKKFFFAISLLTAKKNFHVLLPMMKHFEEFQLIIAGNKNTNYGKELEREIIRMNLGNQVLLPGKIDEPEKNWLYLNAEAFLFPSLAEGFGMPVIEAMKSGKPVFLSKFTSLPEIGGDLAYYFEDFEEISMANLIKEKLEEFERNKQNNSLALIKYAEKFNWESSINQYLELYYQILK